MTADARLISPAAGDVRPRVPVSVVIPAYESEDRVARAVRSVLAQRGVAALEVLVVDDGSGDATADRARAAGAAVHVRSQNGGVSAARNDGLRLAAGDWVAWLDADDAWLEDHLERLWSASDGHVLVASGAVRLKPGAPPRRQGAHADRTVLDPGRLVVPENLVVTSAAMVHRTTALRVGGFALGLRMAEDLDLWLRVAEEGSVRLLDTVTVRRHDHPGQASADRESMHAAYLGLVERCAERPWWRGRVADAIGAVTAWDRLRAALRRRDRADALTAARELAPPRRIAALARVLSARARTRRLSGPFAGLTEEPG